MDQKRMEEALKVASRWEGYHGTGDMERDLALLARALIASQAELHELRGKGK